MIATEERGEAWLSRKGTRGTLEIISGQYQLFERQRMERIEKSVFDRPGHVAYSKSQIFNCKLKQYR